MTVVAKLKVKQGQEEALIAGLRKMIAHVKANEPGTQTYVLHRSTANPSQFLVYEVYADQAAFAAHGGSDAMREFFTLVATLLDGRPEIEMYEELAGKH
jgi:quinol monooxygenase YgiN